MSGRLVSLGVAIALLVLLAGVIVAACYDVPTPDCGFLCGPDGACPAGYICAEGHYCHRIGAPADLVCSAPDAAIPSDARDAAVDAMSDAPVDAMSDAPVDAMSDAAVDAMSDAAVDAMSDAAVDAMSDAAVDAM